MLLHSFSLEDLGINCMIFNEIHIKNEFFPLFCLTYFLRYLLTWFLKIDRQLLCRRYIAIWQNRLRLTFQVIYRGRVLAPHREFFNGFVGAYRLALILMSREYHPHIADCEHCVDFGAGFVIKIHEKRRTEVVVILITGNF